MDITQLALMIMGTILPSGADDGIASIPSRYPAAETLDRLASAAREKGLTVFARIDFGRDALNAGLEMRPSQLLIFGNPKAGTPLMIASPLAAIDLPLKALAWEDADGKAWLSYNTPQYIGERHHLPADLVKNIAGIEVLVKKAVE